MALQLALVEYLCFTINVDHLAGKLPGPAHSQRQMTGLYICLQHGDSKVHTSKAGKTFSCSQVFAFTAPYSQRIEKNKESKVPCPWYRPEDGLKFIEAHGLGVRAVGKPGLSPHCIASSHRCTFLPQVLSECLEKPLKGIMRQRMQLPELKTQSDVPCLHL